MNTEVKKPVLPDNEDTDSPCPAHGVHDLDELLGQSNRPDYSYGYSLSLDDPRQDSRARGTALDLSLAQENQIWMAKNRDIFAASNSLAINLYAGFGAGKTQLLHATVTSMRKDPQLKNVPVTIVVGSASEEIDHQTLSGLGIDVRIAKGVHTRSLDAAGFNNALEELPLPRDGVVLIENDRRPQSPVHVPLGAHERVVMLSVSQGADGIAKLSTIIGQSSLILVSKIDLIPAISFDLELLTSRARDISSQIEVIGVSTQTGSGMDLWIQWLMARRHAMNA